jgi:lipid A 3-O-deacylase
MKFNKTIYALLFGFISFASHCQDTRPASSLLRLSEDNDFINIRFSGADKAYTHGFRADLFYTKKEGESAFAERLMLKAGENSINTFGWGIMQTMITPNDLSSPEIAVSDYRYACSITLSRTRHSSNPVKKYNLQTEYAMGVLGPIALGKETQDAMHKLIHDEIPRGWSTQLKTSPLLNINLVGEKQLFGVGKSLEYIGGVK